MSKPPLRDFPEELLADPWPLLKPTPQDLAYLPRSDTPEEQQRRLQQMRQTQQVHTIRQPQSSPAQHSPLLNLAIAALQGAIFGLALFALIFSILPTSGFWLSNWHWIYLVVGVVLLLLIGGLKRALPILLGVSILGAFWLSWGAVIVSILPIRTFWLSDWHWVYPIVGTVVLILLLGLKRTLFALIVISLLGALWLSRDVFITQPSIPLLFIGCGTIIGCVIGLLPQKRS